MREEGITVMRSGGEAIDADRRKDTIFYRLVRVVLIAD